MTKTKFSDSVWSQRQLDPNFIFVVANAEFCDSVKSQRQVHPNLQGVGGVSDFMAILMIFTARNEVGTRLYFHRHVWFCPQGGSAPEGGACSQGCLVQRVPGPRGCLVTRGAWSRGCLVLGGLLLGCTCSQGGCLVWVPGWGVPGPGQICPWGCLVETPRTATAAGGTHPTGMHSCFVMQNQITFVMQNQRWLPEDDHQRSLYFYTNATVMAPLSMYSIISAPLGLTLGSQCTLETVKCDLLLKNFYSVQNS